MSSKSSRPLVSKMKNVVGDVLIKKSGKNEAIFPFSFWYSMLKFTPPSPNVFLANETTSLNLLSQKEENSNSKGLSPMILLKTDFFGTRKGWFSATFGFVSFSEIKFFTSAVPLSVMVN